MSEATVLVFKRVGSLVYRENDEWPEHIHVTHELLEHADPRYVEEGEGWLTFRVEQGEATYRWTGWDSRYPAGDTAEYDLLDGKRGSGK